MKGFSAISITLSTSRINDRTVDYSSGQIAPLIWKSGLLFSGFQNGHPVFLVEANEGKLERRLRDLLEADVTDLRFHLNENVVEPSTVFQAGDIGWTCHQVAKFILYVDPTDGTINQWDRHLGHESEELDFIADDVPDGMVLSRNQIQNGTPNRHDFPVRQFITLKFAAAEHATRCQSWLRSQGWPAGILVTAPDESWLCWRLSVSHDDDHFTETGDSRHYQGLVDAIKSRFVSMDVDASRRLDASVPIPLVGNDIEINTDDRQERWQIVVTENKLAEIAEDAAMWHPGGLLGKIIDYNLPTAYKRQPELALCGAIALCATIMGRKIRDDSGTRPNIYVVGIADSGSGKEHARQINKMLLMRAGVPRMLSDDLASDAGLLKQMKRSESSLIQLDEIGRILATLTSATKSPHLFKIPTMLMKLFSSSGTIFLGANHADDKHDVMVSNPNCVIFGTTVPASYFGSLNGESLTDGSLNRFVIFEVSDNDPDEQEPEDIEDVPPELLETIKWWIAHNPGSNNLAPTARKLVTSPEAKTEYDSLKAIVRIRRNAEKLRGTQVWVRCSEIARKLGLIHACSLDPEAVAIGVESAKWGCKLALKLTDRMEELAGQYISDGEFDAIGKKLLRFIKEGGDDGRTGTEMSRHFRNLKSRELSEAIDKLAIMGEIDKRSRPSTKGPSALVCVAL